MICIAVIWIVQVRLNLKIEVYIVHHLVVVFWGFFSFAIIIKQSIFSYMKMPYSQQSCLESAEPSREIGKVWYGTYVSVTFARLVVCLNTNGKQSGLAENEQK